MDCTKVMKSKSSNTVTSLTHENNKKSKSNGEFKPNLLKKRGVYVEKKSNTTLNQPVENEPKRKPIPRPNKKKFLNSVLTILSKSTTGTQYPDLNEPECTKKIEKKHKKYKNDQFLTLDDIEPTQRKKKYKSRVLNANKNDYLDLVVLQSNKNQNMDSLPSLNPPSMTQSQKNSEIMKWSNYLSVASLSRKESGLTNVLNSRISKEKRIKIDQSNPSTLVEDQSVKDDQKIYNFFVDLLESTISVYNAKETLEKQEIPSKNSSKVDMVMDEFVAKKLSIEKAKKHEIQANDSTQEVCWRNLNNRQLVNRSFAKEIKRVRTIPYESVYEMPKRNSLIDRRKMQRKSQSFSHRPKPPPKNYNYHKNTQHTYSKADKKKNLLNILKEQLSMLDYTYEEPQNFFQALKIMGQNKRLNQKSIHFEDDIKPASLHDCMYKRQNLLTKKVKRQNVNNSFLKVNKKSKVKKHIDVAKKESELSLQVYEYDFEKPKSPNTDPTLNVFSEATSLMSDLSLVNDYSIASDNDLKFLPQWDLKYRIKM